MTQEINGDGGSTDGLLYRAVNRCDKKFVHFKNISQPSELQILLVYYLLVIGICGVHFRCIGACNFQLNGRPS